MHVRKMLASLGIQRAYVLVPTSVSVHEEEGIMSVSPEYSHLPQIETALMEAERKKAMAMIEIERQRRRMF